MHFAAATYGVVLQEIFACVSQFCQLQLRPTVLHDSHHANSVQQMQHVSVLIQHVLLWACLIHKPALSVTMAACSFPYLSKTSGPCLYR